MARDPACRTRLTLNRKRLLISKMAKALAPAADAFLGDLLVELRKEGGEMPGALLVIRFLETGGVGNREAQAVVDRYHQRIGLRIVSHERRQLDDGERGASLQIILRFAFDGWADGIRDALGDTVVPLLEARLRFSTGRIWSSQLLVVQELDLVDLEQVHAVFQGYWMESVAPIATPTTGRRHGGTII